MIAVRASRCLCRAVPRRVRDPAAQRGASRSCGRSAPAGNARHPRTGRPPQRADDDRSCALLRTGVAHGLSDRTRRADSLCPPRAVRRRPQRRLWRRFPQRLDLHRQATGFQDRHRSVDRRADGAVRLPRSKVRRGAAQLLHDDGIAQHLPRASHHSSAARRRIAGRHRAAARADRRHRRRGIPARDRNGPQPGSPPLCRHRRPRLAAVRDLEHGIDRQQRQPGSGRAVPADSARLVVDPGGVSPGVLQCRGRGAALRRNARRRQRRVVRLLLGRHVQFLEVRAAVGRGPGTEDIFVIHNGQLVADPAGDVAIVAQYRAARVRLGRQGGCRRRPGAHLRGRRARPIGLSLDHDPEWRRDHRRRSVRSREDARALRPRLPDRDRPGPQWFTEPPGLGTSLAP